MNVITLQAAVGAPPDGKWGTQSQAALFAAFTNTVAPAVTVAEIASFALRLGCTVKQLHAVAAVESSGGGFDKQGRPKILFERHIFHRLTEGRWSPCSFSQPKGGGYADSSWVKLAAACGCAPDAAFSACSWGRFQVLGSHWHTLGYASPFELAHSTVASEAAHFDLLARFIEHNGMEDELRSLSTDADDNRPFASLYNGPGYRNFDYHEKLAAAMR